MVQCMKLLCLVAYGVMIANVGMKIYEKYHKNASTATDVWFDNKQCTEYIRGSTNISNVVSLEETIASHELFVYRHLHNKTEQIECFIYTGTNKHKLVKYTRIDVAPEIIQAFFHFERRERLKNDECYKHEYHLTFRKFDGGIVNREVALKCHQEEKLNPKSKTTQKEKPLPKANQPNAPETKKDKLTMTENFIKGFLIMCITCAPVLYYIYVVKPIFRLSKEAAAADSLGPKYWVGITRQEAIRRAKLLFSTGATPKPNSNQDDTAKPQAKATAPESPVAVKNDTQSELEATTQENRGMPVIAEDDDISKEVGVPNQIEIQDEAQSDTEEPRNQASDEDNEDQLNPLDMDISSDESSFEYIN